MTETAVSGTAGLRWDLSGLVADPGATICPAAAEAFRNAEALAWLVVDPALLDLCRHRVAMLLGDTGLVPRPAMSPDHRAKVADVAHWPTSELFDDRERACLAFTEQFVIDVAGMTPSILAPVSEALGDGVAVFVQALFLIDMTVRLDMVLPVLFGTGRPDRAAPAAPAPGEGADLWSAIEDMLRAVARLGSLDPVTTELVRLRGARQHRCRICQSRLSLSALEAVGDRSVFDQIDTYERSDLPEREKVALRLTDAFLTQPSALDATLVDEVRAHFDPDEAIEIIYDVARNATNKFAVALGVDAAQVQDGIELFDIDGEGEVVSSVDPDELKRLLGSGAR